MSGASVRTAVGDTQVVTVMIHSPCPSTQSALQMLTVYCTHSPAQPPTNTSHTRWYLRSTCCRQPPPCAGKSAHAAAFANTPSEGGPLDHDGFTPGSLPDMQAAAAAGSEGPYDMDLDIYLNPEGERDHCAKPQARGMRSGEWQSVTGPDTQLELQLQLHSSF